MMMWQSFVGNASNGATTGWRAPIGRGVSPAKWRAIAFSVIATCESSIATSIFMPSPVRARCTKAALIPTAVKSPAAMSPIDVPTRVGGEPGCPVTLMRPPMPCATKTKAPRYAYGPVWPNPDVAA